MDWAQTAEELGVGEPTLRDIADALARPERDPREDLPKPIFKKGVLRLEDLAAGMELKGTVLNVVDFGAFVDVGLKDSGLVHISQLANRYIKSPHDVVSVGDVVSVWVMGVDPERKRVSLTMVEPGTERQRGPGGPGGDRRRGGGEGGPGQGGPPRGDRRPPRREGEGPGGPGRGGRSEGAPPPQRGLRIPGPPQRMQGRGGPGGGRGGPGGGGSRRFERAADRPPPPSGAAATPAKPNKPAPPPPPLTKDALTGSTPLRTFGQLKQLFEARTQTPEEEAAEAAAAREARPDQSESAPPASDAPTSTENENSNPESS